MDQSQIATANQKQAYDTNTDTRGNDEPKYCRLHKDVCTPDAEGFGGCGDKLSECSWARLDTRGMTFRQCFGVFAYTMKCWRCESKRACMDETNSMNGSVRGR